MRAIALGLFFATTSVFACPDLSGKYAKCRTEGEEARSRLEVSQKTKWGVTTYTLVSIDASTNESETETYRADGKTQVSSERDPETGATVSLATTVACVANTVKADMILTYEDEVYSKVTTTFNKDGNKFVQQVNEDHGNGPQVYTVICE